jgi:hypothetical protein
VESLQTFLSVIGSPYLDALLLMRSTRSSGAFAADHSAVDWVLAVALNVADLSVLEVNVKQYRAMDPDGNLFDVSVHGYDVAEYADQRARRNKAENAPA